MCGEGRELLEEAEDAPALRGEVIAQDAVEDGTLELNHLHLP